MTIERYLLHCDDISFGVYQIPFTAARGDDPDTGPKDLPRSNLGFIRSARTDGNAVRVYGPATRVLADIRVPSIAKQSVHSWVRFPATAALVVLIEAMHNFWTNRFRLTNDTRRLEVDVVKRLELEQLNAKRRTQREKLYQHQLSLRQKLWALRYHRSGFYDALDQLSADRPSHLFQLTRATAEYNALTACMYAFLEELTSVLSIFEGISRGKNRKPSFHQLHKNRAAEEGALRDLLDTAEWYEGFRLRRANTAHAFGNIIALQPDETDPYLMQHPDARIYSEQPLPPAVIPNARSATETLVAEFDAFLVALSRYMLAMFHPWDSVSLYHLRDDGNGFEASSVWVRHVLFRPQRQGEPEPWAGFDDQGRVAFRTDSRGGLIPIDGHLEAN